MSDYTATITELALLGGDNPTIKTAGGRTLRRGCDCPSCINEHDGLIDHDENCRCQGRGWLPVSEDTAVVVCLEWFRYPSISRGLSGEWHISVFMENNRKSVTEKTLPAAVFAAAKAVAGAEGVDQ